jgi:hypothetical protein
VSLWDARSPPLSTSTVTAELNAMIAESFELACPARVASGGQSTMK